MAHLLGQEQWSKKKATLVQMQCLGILRMIEKNLGVRV